MKTIKQDNSEYILVVKFLCTTNIEKLDDITTEETVTIPMDNIVKLELINSFSDPILNGYMEIMDGVESYMDRFVGSNGNFILIGLNKQESNSSMSNGVPEIEWQYQHLFVIDTLDVLSRNGSQVDYGIRFKSINWFNFVNSQPYSTFKQPMEPYISETLKQLYKNNGLTTGLKWDDFSSVEQNRRHYITHAGQTLMNSNKQLLKYINSITDIQTSGLIDVVYDHVTDEYDIWTSKSVTDGMDSSAPSTNSIKLTLSQNALSTLVESMPTKIFLKNYTGQTDTISKLRDWTNWEYDYKGNTFSRTEITQKQMIESLGNTTNTDYTNSLPSFDDFIPPSMENQHRNYSYERSQWNINNTHERMLSTLVENNVLTLNTVGEFNRKVGESIYFNIDMDTNTPSPLQYLIGWWTCLRVRHIFTQDGYSNNVMLGRFNELRDIENIRGNDV